MSLVFLLAFLIWVSRSKLPLSFSYLASFQCDRASSVFTPYYRFEFITCNLSDRNHVLILSMWILHQRIGKSKLRIKCVTNKTHSNYGWYSQACNLPWDLCLIGKNLQLASRQGCSGTVSVSSAAIFKTASFGWNETREIPALYWILLLLQY